MVKILGLDPGGTTGYAFCSYSPEGGRDSLQWTDIGEVRSPDMGTWLRQKLGLIDVVVCEDFIIRPGVKKWAATTQTDNGVDTAKLVGKIQLACEWMNKPVKMFLPHEKAMGYNLLGLEYVKGRRNMHRQDAMAHARLFIRKAYKV